MVCDRVWLLFVVVVVVSDVACLTCELCFGTSRSVLDPSWFGLRPFPCVKGSYLRLDFKGPALSLTQAEHGKFRRQQAPTIVLMLWTSVVSFSPWQVFRTVLCFAEVDQNPPIRRNTQKQHLQNSDQNLTTNPRKKLIFEKPA